MGGLTVMETKMSKKVALLSTGVFTYAGAAWAQGEGTRYYGPQIWEGGWWMFFGPLWMIVFVGAIVVGIVLLVRWVGEHSQVAGPKHTATKTPMDILKERFARGEIDKEEFEERRRRLLE